MRSVLLFLTFLLLIVLVFTSGQSDIDQSLIDINILSDSQSTVVFITKTTELSDHSQVINQLVHNSGLVQFLPGLPLTHHSECLRLMLKLCYP